MKFRIMLIVLAAIVQNIYADWHRDFDWVQAAGSARPMTIERGVVVADVVPLSTWPGKEIVTCNATQLFISRGGMCGTCPARKNCLNNAVL